MPNVTPFAARHEVDLDVPVNSRLGRRALLAGVLAVPLLYVWREGWQNDDSAIAAADNCQSEPGVEFLRRFNLGAPGVPFADLLAPADWVLHPNQANSMWFRYPPGWRPEVWWADQFTRDGAPIWTAQQPWVASLFSVRAISPNGDAMFEMAGGTVMSHRLSLDQAATLAERGAVGNDVQLTPICEEELPSPLGPMWFRASAFGDFVLVTQGVPFTDPTGFANGTGLGYYSMYGPRDEFDALAHDVFVRILYQLYPDPITLVTPTPTP